MYFKDFPRVAYQFPDDIVRNYKNLSIRPAVSDMLKGIYSNLEEYTIQDGETPETLAFDFYDDANLHWAIMLVNNIMNVYRDWPKTSNQLQAYLISEYQIQKDSDGVDVTLTEAETMEYLEFAGTTTNNFQTYVTGTTVLMRPHHFEDADGNEYSFDSKDNTVDVFGNTIIMPELFPISHYQYEFELNESKRNILIPNNGIVQKMKRELVDLLNE